MSMTEWISVKPIYQDLVLHDVQINDGNLLKYFRHNFPPNLLYY
jgi:hypothetical protein